MGFPCSSRQLDIEKDEILRRRMENMNKQKFDKHYNDSLEHTQKEIAQGDELYYVCGFAPKYSIPTDTTPGHLGLPERVHAPIYFNLLFETHWEDIEKWITTK